MNGLSNVLAALEKGSGEIQVEASIAARARRPIDRMLDFAAIHKKRVKASGDLAQDSSLFARVGPA